MTTVRPISKIKMQKVDNRAEIYKFILSKYLPIIQAFKSGNGEVGITVPLPKFAEPDLLLLTQTALQLIKLQPPVLRLKPGILIVGDLHGNLINLIHILAQHGMPPEQNYIFLGNIVNFGEFSLETITLIYALYCSYPNNVSILRGDSETFPIQIINSLHDEIKNMYQSTQLFQALLNTFSFLPIAAIFGQTVLCTQSTALTKYGSLQNMIHQKGPSFCETNADGFAGYVQDAPIPDETTLNEFMAHNKIEMMILGGNIDETGITSYCDERVYSISTCESTGAAGIMLLTGDLKPSPVVFVSNSELVRSKALFQQVEKSIKTPISQVASAPCPSGQRSARIISASPRPNIIIPSRIPTQSSIFKFKSSTPKPFTHAAIGGSNTSSTSVIMSRM